MVVGLIQWRNTSIVESEDTGTLYLIDWDTLSNRAIQYKGQARYTPALASNVQLREVTCRN